MRPFLLALLAAFLSTSARADHFYPPLPAAKSAIDFDNHGFLINGKRTWISSAGIEYARVPHELWRDRLLKIKRAGFNCVEIYAFWNYHETAPGQWDFRGDKDVGAFLDLAHELGLYVTVRVGPYVCAEWENGGYPNWLRFIPGLRTRQDEPRYMAAVDAWYDRILPIVASHQINHGGSVIMVQLENEDDEGWGAWKLDPVKQSYFQHLLDKARAKGIEVLTFFSGMNHGGDPAPKMPIKSADQHDPWFTTEYWSGWYNQYGNFIGSDKDALTHYDRAAWRFLENGANGFNIYMFHGGSNFDHWNNNETAASYDYAGAIGQAGDLRPIYYKYKRAAMFAHSFEDILENCELAPVPAEYNLPGLTTTARTGSAGTVVFLDNPGDKPVDAKFADGTVMTLAPGEVTGLVRDFQLDRETKLASSEARILGVLHQGEVTTVVFYGSPETKGRVNVAVAPESVKLPSSVEIVGDLHGTAVVETTEQTDLPFPAEGQPPFVSDLSFKGHHLRFVSLNSDQADKTYFIDTETGAFVVTGAYFIGPFEMDGQNAHYIAQEPLEASMSPRVWVFGPDHLNPSPKIKPRMIARPAGGSSHQVQREIDELVPDNVEKDHRNDFVIEPEALPSIKGEVPTLAHWQSASAAAEIAPGYDDAKWMKAENPPAMGADGDGSPFAWYRTTIHADAAGTKTLQVPYIGDQAEVWLNGQRVNGPFLHGPAAIPLDLKSGDNTLAIFTSHNGRAKLGNYGSIEHVDVKGLVGPVRLVKTDSPFIALTHCVTQAWWKDQPPVEQLIGADVDTSKWDSRRSFSGDWGGTAAGSWRAPFVCVRATLPDIAGPKRVLRVGFFDEKATFYLNGQKIGAAHNDLWNAAKPRFYDPAPTTPPVEETPLVNGPLELSLNSARKEGGPNILTVILENSHAQATIGLVALTSGDPGTVVAGWKMRGGVIPSGDQSLAWQSAPADAPKVPTYYRTTFTIPADYYKQATPVLRLSTKGMSRGSAWLNGHNLGRYPEKIPIDGPWLPECWLKPGANELVVLDEEGAAIAPAHLWVETEASRRSWY